MTADLALLSAAAPPSERPDEAGGGNGGHQGDGGHDGGGKGEPPKRRRFGWWKLPVSLLIVAVLLVVLALGAVYGVLTTPRGTAFAWQTAVKVLGGKLTGTLEGGALGTGVQLRDVRWRSLDGSGTDIKVDRVNARWALTRAPWRLTLDFLHVDTIDARVGSSSSTESKPLTLPKDLRLPMQLDVRDVSVNRLLLRQGGSVTEFDHFRFHGRSDGRHHEAAIESLNTPFGSLTASAKLDGQGPFPLTGDIGYSGKVNNEAVQVGGHLSGTLDNLVAELDASGMKLTGHAHVEATPFAPVPLQRAMLRFDHVNPQAFAPGAPLADLAVRADLQPVSADALDAAAKASDTDRAKGVDAAVARAASLAMASATSAEAASAAASATATAASAGTAKTAKGAKAASTPAAAPAGSASDKAAAFAVAGKVSIVNAKPGLIGAHLLPLIDARADVLLDAQSQRISNLNVRLEKTATITGGGALSGKRGQFDLKVAGLDLSTFQSAVRPTQLAGPISIRLNDDIQSVALDLADPKAQLRAQGKIVVDPARTSFNDVRVSVGRGRIDLSGALKKDANSTYNVKAQLTDFDPLSLTTQTPARAPAAKATKAAGGTKRAAKPATDANASPETAVRSVPAPAAASKKIDARVNGTLTANGVLGPVFSTKAEFKLGPSVYDNLPLTGGGTIQLVGSRILPSRASLSVAGNDVDLNGSFGAPGDRLRFHVDAPQLDRLGFGVAGKVSGDGDLTGTFEHPNVTLTYAADSVVFGSNRLGHAQGHAELRDGANGAMVFTTDARDFSTPGVELATLNAQLNGTRANHTLTATTTGKLQGRPIDLSVAANGKLTEGKAGSRWDGTVTKLSNHGMPELNMERPLTVSAEPGHIVLGPTHLTIEGATLDLKTFLFDHGRMQSAGTLTNVSLLHLQEIRQQITGEPPAVKTDLVFDGDWDFSLGSTASGHIQLKRRSGDVTVEVGRGLSALGVRDLSARADFSNGNRLNATVHAQASRIGTVDANAHTTLVPRDGVLTVDENAAVTGGIDANVPSLRTTGGLFGPSYLLDGKIALELALGGTIARPNLSGALRGDGLSATAVDQGLQLKDGVIRIALSQNLVDFQQVEFHGASGTLRATGRVRLDNDEPDLTANIVADKLQLFAAPDRNLSLSGSASVANAGAQGGLNINGKFTVDHALFDLPEQSAPSLGDDVVVVRPDGTVAGEKPEPIPGSNKPVGPFAPRANIDIDLGRDFRFRGQGADLGLAGTVTMMSAPNQPLRAVGNVRVTTPGSTYTAFGRKLNIENGFFTFNGPVANPGINILAMRRNQQVEAGVQVTGTVQQPNAKLISEPSVPDNDKLSWLLFGHGTDQGNNTGQQSSMTAALALLGNAGGKRIANTFGVDEFSIGQSDVGLTDPQVVMVSKAINERLVLGFEQGLQTSANAIKATINLTRFWSLTAFGGTFDGLTVFYTRRFDRIRW